MGRGQGGQDKFSPVMGDQRGVSRPELDELDARRAEIFAALGRKVTYTTSDDLERLSPRNNLRYVAVARSEHDDALHIAGAIATTGEAKEIFDGLRGDDFIPAWLIDLNAFSVEQCALEVESDGTVFSDEPELSLEEID